MTVRYLNSNKLFRALYLFPLLVGSPNKQIGSDTNFVTTSWLSIYVCLEIKAGSFISHIFVMS